MSRSQSKPDAGDEKRIKALEVEIVKNSNEVASLREKSSGISEQIKELQNKILEVGGVKLRAIQSKFSTTKGLLDLANDAITKAEVGQSKAKHDVEKLTKAIDSNTLKLEEVEEELGVVNADLEASEGDLRTIRDKVQEAQDASTDGQEALQASKAELDEKSTEINAFRKLEVSLRQEV
jgi:structural maintenance of chromosome 4